MQSRSLKYSPKNGRYEHIPRALRCYLFLYSTPKNFQKIVMDFQMAYTNRKSDKQGAWLAYC